MCIMNIATYIHTYYLLYTTNETKYNLSLKVQSGKKKTTE